jgi:hypothetical protein
MSPSATIWRSQRHSCRTKTRSRVSSRKRVLRGQYFRIPQLPRNKRCVIRKISLFSIALVVSRSANSISHVLKRHQKTNKTTNVHNVSALFCPNNTFFQHYAADSQCEYYAIFIDVSFCSGCWMQEKIWLVKVPCFRWFLNFFGMRIFVSQRRQSCPCGGQNVHSCETSMYP